MRIATHENTVLLIILRCGLELVHQFVRRNRIVTKVDRTVSLDGDGNRLGVRIDRFRIGFWQIHIDAAGHHWRRDHEDDQQHQHDVDKRRDVDVRHRTTPTA